MKIRTQTLQQNLGQLIISDDIKILKSIQQRKNLDRYHRNLFNTHILLAKHKATVFMVHKSLSTGVPNIKTETMVWFGLSAAQQPINI
jgi:hypothetical protein